MTDILLLQCAGLEGRLRPIAGVRYVPSSCDELSHHLTADIPPAMLIIDSASLVEGVIRLLDALSRRGLLPPVIVWLQTTDAKTLATAWQLLHASTTLVFSLNELRDEIRSRAHQYAASPAAYLKQRRSLTCRAVRLLDLLEADPAMRTLPIDKLAQKCGTSRAGLYSLLASSGLPTPEHLQMLFRLWPAIIWLRRGATTDESAAHAQLSDGRSLRRALNIRFRRNSTAIRACQDWRQLIDAWLESHGNTAR